MYTIEQFEQALLQLDVEIDEIKLKGKYVSKAIGKINERVHHWKANGVCENLRGERKPLYDLKLG